MQDRSNSGAGAKLFIESVDSDNSTPLIHGLVVNTTPTFLQVLLQLNFKVGNGSSAGEVFNLWKILTMVHTSSG